MKDPDDRWQTIRDLAAELRWVVESHDVIVQRNVSRPRRAWLERLAWVIVASALLTTVAWLLLRVPVTTGATRLTLTIPPALDLQGGGGDRLLAMSPDGRSVAFVATSGGKTQIYLRRTDRFDAVAATEPKAVSTHSFHRMDSGSGSSAARFRLAASLT